MDSKGVFLRMKDNDNRKKVIPDDPKTETSGRTFTQRTTIANAPGADAIRVLDNRDNDPSRTQEMLAYIEETALPKFRAEINLLHLVIVIN